MSEATKRRRPPVGKIEILRSQLGTATHVIFTIGKGGTAGVFGTFHDSYINAKAGQDGAAVIQYYA